MKEHIKAHKISVEKFALYIDVPRSTLYRWMKDGLSVDVWTVYNIATALGVSLEYLITGKDGHDAEQRMQQIEDYKTRESNVRKLLGKMQEEMKG